MIQQVSKNLDIILLVASILFVIIAIMLIVYMSKVIVYPLNKFLKSRDEEKSTEQIELRKILLHTTEGIIAFNLEDDKKTHAYHSDLLDSRAGPAPPSLRMAGRGVQPHVLGNELHQPA